MKGRKSIVVKIFGILLLLFTTFVLSMTAEAAEPYPSKTVRFIVPTQPGGASDILARLIATKLSERFGKQVIVDNRSGAGGVIGTEMVAKSPPDGYTILNISAPHAYNAALYKLPFDPVKDFAFVARLATGPSSLVVHPSVPAKTLKEFIALLTVKPGQIICAAAGVGSFSHLGAELFKLMTKTEFEIVQFKGGGPAMTDQLGGHSQMSFGSLLQTLPYIQSGKFRVLGTGGLKRSVMLPDVPTISEAGLPGYEGTNWWGIIAPAGTPAPIVERLNKEVSEILLLPDVQKQLLTNGAEVDHISPSEFGPFVAAEISKWGRVIKVAGIKGEQ